MPTRPPRSRDPPRLQNERSSPVAPLLGPPPLPPLAPPSLLPALAPPVPLPSLIIVAYVRVLCAFCDLIVFTITISDWNFVLG
ncbi:hypothetical protein TWF481_002632 [Arthrobotrys musiformis]|uniref:Uncharacterized protein n=1 Tax=Arthrobotrys musiformis TaxID=47236 RepID=A0AAV9VSX8_9PEZI